MIDRKQQLADLIRLRAELVAQGDLGASNAKFFDRVIQALSKKVTQELIRTTF